MRSFSLCIIAILCLCSCSVNSKYADLQDKLSTFCKDKDAKIGVAVIIDGKDTVAVNGNERFPMLSVYKFPIAMALAEQYRQHDLPLDFPLSVYPEDLHPDTYSPMTEEILKSSLLSTDTLKMPTSQILAYMLQQSDNNASDIALRQTGGAKEVDRYLRKLGMDAIHVCSSEAEMHADNSLCYGNFSTPLAMAGLFYKFDSEFNDSISIYIKHLMETCTTGLDRLAKPLADNAGMIGHKTGTGFTLPDGRLMAVNDAGYIRLSDGRRYSIAVFIENSGYAMSETEALIAEISKIICDTLSQ